jgi:hypothetical protein
MKIEKLGHIVLGRNVAHGFGLSAQPSRGNFPRHGDGARAPGVLVTRSPHAVHTQWRASRRPGGARPVTRFSR